ncbi:tRNA (N6-threonylcarbamoyladenosine(37)-N6)-methyltransferase TrmO [Aliiroseovarius sp. PrR006]|uniref:tRNA (N6-threonylcarbamoyladenosine(37)-N6)-methyltransferase TrmO n=1 Tax=Aliiroseovarius sp. PrR006 TaxID=2706883 RepID=UPI0013D2A756|nr:tRNA (N6-threonylcarbamoyladenosine(37)-N6)-methyltransferase TrmO [Aliiroseovarius sp. PrR006]NDW54714.1 tRNA (N6-threonylcarbamoyladenosine(37)-N6)-methyltransferase TrmO [Aliiroseovarius sp. PrR006]
MSDRREGEVQLAFDPADSDGPRVAFIGHVRTPWQPGDAPGNVAGARKRVAEEGGAFRIELAEGYQPGIKDFTVGQHIIVLYWMDQARRDLIVQSPRHADAPRGVFSLRSPSRPNPIAMSTVQIVSLDIEAGVIGIDALDCFDATPVVDLKPWIATIDAPVA